MSLRNVGIVYRKELTEALRDRRTVISTILVPLLLFPVLSVGFGSLAVALVGKAKEEVPKVMLRGGEDSPEVVKGLKKLDTIEIVPETPGWKDQVINKEIRAAVEIPSGFQVDVARQKSDTVKIFNYQGASRKPCSNPLRSTGKTSRLPKKSAAPLSAASSAIWSSFSA